MSSELISQLPADLFNPERLPARDENGMVLHPDCERIFSAFGEVDEGEAACKFIESLGYEITAIEMDQDPYADEKAVDRYFEQGESSCAFWSPSTPHGDGWVMVCIGDTDEGPTAWYIRREQEEA